MEDWERQIRSMLPTISNERVPVCGNSRVRALQRFQQTLVLAGLNETAYIRKLDF